MMDGTVPEEWGRVSGIVIYVRPGTGDTAGKKMAEALHLPLNTHYRSYYSEEMAAGDIEIYGREIQASVYSGKKEMRLSFQSWMALADEYWRDLEALIREYLKRLEIPGRILVVSC